MNFSFARTSLLAASAAIFMISSAAVAAVDEGAARALAKKNDCFKCHAVDKTKKGPSGRIAVLGPTRMNYERVVSAIEYFSSLIEEIC